MLSCAAEIARRLATQVILTCMVTRTLLCGIDVDSIPKPTGYVSDLANVISETDKDQLEQLCADVDRQLGVQFAFLTVDTIGDRPIRDFGLDVGRKWGVGSNNTNQGLLVILAVNQRHDDIEVGRGLEPYVTDGFAGSVRRAMAPLLRQGQYGAALIGAAQALAQHVAEGKGIGFSFQGVQPPPRPRPVDREKGVLAWLFILGIFFLFWLIGRGGGRRGGGGIGDLATGMLIGDLLNRGRRDPRWGGDGGGGGGGFGGGSEGGGGFGGFGGGDFGGGGASGDW